MEKKKPMSRAELRRAYCKVRGKKVKVVTYIKVLAEELPALKNPDTGKTVNHKEELQNMYKQKGLPGIKEYIQAVNEVIEYAKEKEKNNK